MRKYLPVLLFAFVLSACTSRVDGRADNPLTITVSKSRAAVAEPVTVTLTGGFVNIAEANSPDYIIPNFRLGACFAQAVDQGYETRGGLCLDKDSPLPAHIVISEGESYQKAFGKQVVESGEEVVLEHTFSFTSTEPGLIRIAAMSQIIYEDLSQPAFANSLDTTVRFE